MNLLENIASDVQEGYREKVKAGIATCLSKGVSPEDILHHGLIVGMHSVAQKFKSGQMFLPEVLAVAGAMKAGMALLQPQLERTNVQPLAKIVLGTVKGDLHDIGKNLVLIMLEGAGYKVIDLGTDVTPEKFVDAVRKEQPEILGLSALLTTTMVHMKGVIEALEQHQMRASVKIIVGGAPISQSYASDIKADGYAKNAAEAVDLVRTLV
jgi:5-methyltetrahydrofolate--homocysteine methyltransferase